MEYGRHYLHRVGAAGAGHLDHHDDNGSGKTGSPQGKDQHVVDQGKANAGHHRCQYKAARMQTEDVHIEQIPQGGDQGLGDAHKKEQRHAPQIMLGHGQSRGDVLPAQRGLDEHSAEQGPHPLGQHGIKGGHLGAIAAVSRVHDLRFHLDGRGDVAVDGLASLMKEGQDLLQKLAVGQGLHKVGKLGKLGAGIVQCAHGGQQAGFQSAQRVAHAIQTGRDACRFLMEEIQQLSCVGDGADGGLEGILNGHTY